VKSTMTRERKSVLTKGIIDWSLQHGKSPDETITKETIANIAKEAPLPELRAIYENPEQAVLEMAKQIAMSGETSTQAVYKALETVESLVSDARSKFTNLYSPGAVTAIISALDRSRLRGWTDQNAIERLGPGYVSGGEDKKTPDYEGNPSSPGDGFEVGIGRERYGSQSAGGSGEDRSRGKAPTSQTRYGFQGAQQPDNVTASPGRSGNYGHGSEVLSTVGPDGKVVVKYHNHPSYKPNANPSKVTKAWFQKLGEGASVRNEDVQDLYLTKPEEEFKEEELREALRRREEELRRKAEEEGEDEIVTKAKDALRNDLQKRLWAKRILSK
jgi:hypothetical protein